MESMIVNEFSKRTGTDLETAHMYLQSVDWDVSKALKAWHQNHGSTTQIDKVEVKKLARGLSRATDNESLVLQARSAIAKDFENNCLYRLNNCCLETPDSTFVLPDFYAFEEHFRKYVEKDLIEKSVMVSLEAANRLNWWCTEIGETNKLWPLSTTGDGNCLLHAASLSIFGFHDRLLTLRRALHHFMINSHGAPAIKRRWRWQQTKSNLQSAVQYSEIEWEKEWSDLLDIASPRRRKSHQQGTYESLEEIHILALANVLQRVIIVVSETMLKDSYNEPLSPIHFGGIYLPFECEEKKCFKVPLLLTYDMAHFSALVFMDRNNDPTISTTFYMPLVDSNGTLLPIQFSVDPGLDFNWNNYPNSGLHTTENSERDQLNIIKNYLNVVDVCNGSNSPDNESEDEIERHFVEYADQNDNDSNMFSKKNKATKQLEVLGKQMGSIGKSMGKKLKKNFGSLTRLTKSPKKNDAIRTKLICMEIKIKRHPYQDEIIKNYLKFAENKFFAIHVSNIQVKTPEEILLKEQALQEGPLKCINNNCNGYATCITSYMCLTCYKRQKEQESKIKNESYHGVGKSKFYRDPDTKIYNAVKDLPKSTIKQDKTIYLCNSTFFNDTGTPPPDNLHKEEPKKKTKTLPISTEVENQFNSEHLQKIISECDFGTIDIPDACKKSLPIEVPTSSRFRYTGSELSDINSNLTNYESVTEDTTLNTQPLPLITQIIDKDSSNQDNLSYKPK